MSPGSPRGLSTPGLFPFFCEHPRGRGNRKPEFREAEQGTPSTQGFHVQSWTPQLDTQHTGASCPVLDTTVRSATYKAHNQELSREVSKAKFTKPHDVSGKFIILLRASFKALLGHT